MIRRISDLTKKKYTTIIRDIIDDLGRPVEVFKKPSKYECLNCHYDKLKDSSTGICKWTPAEAFQKQSDYENSGGVGTRYKFFSKGRCPICKGKGYLETIRKVWVKCKITWDPEADGTLVHDSPGVAGSTSVELKTDPKYLDLFKNCVYLKVDNMECVLAKPPTLRGIGSKSLLIVLAFTSDGVVNTDDQQKDYLPTL